MRSMHKRRRLLLKLMLAAGLLAAGAAVSPAVPAAAPAAALTRDQLRTLAALVADLFPHAALDQSHYQNVVAALTRLLGDAGQRRLIIAGLAQLDGAAGRRWRERAPAQRLARLKQLESAAFFQLLRYHSMQALYSDPAVWALYGYQGESLSKGGYLQRGFNDLDWLPEPGVEAGQ